VKLDPSARTAERDGPAGPDAPLARGDLLEGTYRIERRLGEGGMGSVYEVTHVPSGAPFAAKVVDAPEGSSEGAVERLLREARSLASLEHPHIVEAVHFGRVPGRVFIVMELLRGEDLQRRLKRRAGAGLPDDEVRAILFPVLDALALAHRHGVIHRDLKPANLFLVGEGAATVPKLVDFGLSKLRGDDLEQITLTRAGQVLGTPLYMAPEQARSTADVDRRVDIYAMGCVVFEMLTGRVPYPARTLQECLVRHAMDDVPRLEADRPDLPEALGRVLHRCLAKDPEDRFERVEDLVQALEAAWPPPPRGRPASPRAPAAAPARARRVGERPSAASTRGVWSALFWVLVLVGGLTGLAAVASRLLRLTEG
jgi:serine/threonine protein kinase